LIADIWSVPLAILTSVGGGAVIVVALVRRLAGVTAKRILQNVALLFGAAQLRAQAKNLALGFDELGRLFL
jgi:hypothetical protein